MRVTFWGVRGSTPAPGAPFVRYGGHTTCVSVVVGESVLVLDAGTGIRPLGRSLVGLDEELFVLLTHLHADHVIGFPFFAPLYEEGRTVHLLDYDTASWSPLALFDGVHYPLHPGDLPCAVRRVGGDPVTYLAEQGIELARQTVNHPGGAFGYRITHEGRSFVFIPDDELDPPSRAVDRAEIVAFCRGADVLCHDAQYLASEMAERRGWGHSSVEQAVELAIEAGVGNVVLFHHDPDRTDDDLDVVHESAASRLASHGIGCVVAFEGLTFELGSGDVKLPPPTLVATRAESA